MPKLKTNKSAAKRFRVTGSGRVKRARAFKNHILTKKSRQRKRRLRQGAIIEKVDAPNIRMLLPYGN